MARQQGRQDLENREELYTYLEGKMQHSYEQLRDKGEVESGSSFVKSFLLECDWKPQGIGREEEKNYLCDLFSVQAEGKKKKSSDAQIIETNESGFYIVNWTWNDELITLYLDTISDSSRRFWRAYSVSSAHYLDDIINRLIDSKIYLDRTWLWSRLLESTQQESEPRGFRFEHDRSYFEKEKGEHIYSEPFSLKFSGSQRESQLLWELMRQNRELSTQTSLANVRMKYSMPHAREEFTIETLYFNGKFTTNGTSFSAHQALINDVQNLYANKVYQIERDYIILTTADETKWHVTGNPVVFDLSDSQIEDIDTFCRVVFSGKMPFKLWGTPRPTSSGEGRNVLAVDLHNGAKLFFEVYPEIICMYLSAGACGNTAIRFYTNLQRTFSRLVDVQDDSGNQFF